MIESFKTRIAVAAFLTMALTATVANAKTFSIPNDDPVATIDIPGEWSPDTFDTGVEATSSDSGIYLSAESVKATDISGAVSDTLKTLGKQGLVIDPSSKKVTDFEGNGLKFHDFAYKGKDKDGPTNFDLTLVETHTPGIYLMLSYWGSDDAEKANDKALTGIVQSIELTK